MNCRQKIKKLKQENNILKQLCDYSKPFIIRNVYNGSLRNSRIVKIFPYQMLEKDELLDFLAKQMAVELWPLVKENMKIENYEYGNKKVSFELWTEIKGE